MIKKKIASVEKRELLMAPQGNRMWCVDTFALTGQTHGGKLINNC